MMHDRRKLSKAEREAVYNKLGGHCAYCGTEISYGEMQADHVASLYGEDGPDTIANLLPACRSCNHYKSSMTLERFRTAVEAMPDVLMRDSVTYRNAVRFGLVRPEPQPIVFYFEARGEQHELS